MPRPNPTTVVTVGVIAGLAWAASLRAMMSEIAGPYASVSWTGTFVWILAPGAAIGGLLGWAEHVRRTGGRRGWRWLALSPLLFAAVLFSNPSDLGGVFDDGVGAGTVAVPVMCMLGGYALSGRGPVWARVCAGAAFLAGPVAWALTAESVGGPEFALTTPHGAWIAVLFYALLAELAIACSIPHRRVVMSVDAAAAARGAHEVDPASRPAHIR